MKETPLHSVPSLPADVLATASEARTADLSQLLQVRVTARIEEAEGIARFELEALSGELPPFTAGAHIDVHPCDGIVRQYSLCGDPGDRSRYTIAVLRDSDSRGGSRAMHELVQTGSTLRISAPRNCFPLVDGRNFLLFAGGIGITPILSMAYQLRREARSFQLHYCTRSEKRTAFSAPIQQAFPDNVAFYTSGTVLDLGALLMAPDPDTHIYVCGPAGFIEHVRDAARAQGWPDNQVHFEHFQPVPVTIEGDQAFEVRLAQTGTSVTVGARETVVEALARVGVEVPVSCEQGVCGTCLTRVLDGVPDHRDQFLTDSEKARNNEFTPCCSRAKSPVLVLDL